MAKNEVAIVGRNRLAEEFLELSRGRGLEATLTPGAEGVNTRASLVMETSAGDEEEKKGTVKTLDETLPSSSVILTSCLGFSPTRIGSWAGRPERVVGFATFYPIKVKKVIELTGGLKTEETFMRQAEDFLRDLGKNAVRIKGAPGLVFPRILSLIINEAARSLDEGVASAEEIDVALKLGTNYPLGPLRWADQVGLDEVLAVLEGLHRETGDDRYRPAARLKNMVLAGWLGESTGRGFYSHR